MIQIIKDFLIPEIEKNHTIEIEILDSHNPIRISSINGIEYDPLGDWIPRINPKSVEIKANKLLKYLKKKRK